MYVCMYVCCLYAGAGRSRLHTVRTQKVHVRAVQAIMVLVEQSRQVIQHSASPVLYSYLDHTPCTIIVHIALPSKL